MPNYLNNHKRRGIRNNNPGNLVRTSLAWQGKIPFPQSKDVRFEQFKEMKYGIRAFFRDIVNDVDKGQNTITKLISSFAPPHENNTQAYISQVSKAVGLGANEEIKIVSKSFLFALAKVVFEIENTRSDAQVITNQDLEDAFTIIGSFNLKNITVKSKISFLGTTILFIMVFFLYIFHSKNLNK